MSAKKYLIVNADDFGRSDKLNRGIIEAHEGGIVTSASLMVRWPSAADAAAYAKDRPDFSVGLHLDLGEWVYHDGTWDLLYEVVPMDEPASVRLELSRQLAAFRDLTGKNPSHIDSHQHVHLRELARSVVLDEARRLNVPVRGADSQIHHCGHFYGQLAEGAPRHEGITVEALINIFSKLQPGITELGCHPGYAGDFESVYSAEREQELSTLRDPRVREALRAMGVELRSFRELSDIYLFPEMNMHSQIGGQYRCA